MVDRADGHTERRRSSSSRVREAKPVIDLIIAPRAHGPEPVPAVDRTLQRIQLRIDASGPREELVVAAHLCDSSTLESDDRVRTSDRREPVRDDE